MRPGKTERESYRHDAAMLGDLSLALYFRPVVDDETRTGLAVAEQRLDAGQTARTEEAAVMDEAGTGESR